VKYYHYVLTLNGSAQDLNTLLSNTNDDQLVSSISFQPAAANAGAVFIGGSNTTVSATSYAVRLPVPDSSVPSAPYMIDAYRGGGLSLTDFSVIGTNNDKLHVGIVVMR